MIDQSSCIAASVMPRPSRSTVYAPRSRDGDGDAHFGESSSAVVSAASRAASAKPGLLAQDFHHGSEVPLTAATGDSFDEVIMNDSSQRRGGARLVS